MKRTRYQEPELELVLKTEMLRRGKPVAELIRALRAYLGRGGSQAPPGTGAFRSGRRDSAEKAETLLAKTGFGKGRRPEGAS